MTLVSLANSALELTTMRRVGMERKLDRLGAYLAANPDERAT